MPSHSSGPYDEDARQLVHRLTTTLESITDTFFLLDGEWRFTYVNKAAETLLRQTRTQLLGTVIWDRFPGTFQGVLHRAALESIAENKTVDVESYSEVLGIWVEVHIFPSEEGLAIYVRDITERRREQERLRLLEASVSQLNDIVIVTEAEPLDEPGPRIVFVNAAFERIAGYTSAEVVGRSPRFLQGPLTRRGELDRIRAAMRKRESVQVELVNYRKSGEAFWLELTVVPVLDASGAVTHCVAVERDITERKRADLRLERLNRLYVVLSRIAEAIVRTDDRKTLYERACRILVEDGLLRMAFVGEVEADTKRVRSAAAFGEGVEYLRSLIVTVDDGPHGRGTVGTALRTGRHDVCNDIAADPRMDPWREAALRFDFRATASFPLCVGVVVVGALVLFATEPGYFQDDEIRLMDTVAADISFALEAIDREERRRLSDAALLKSEERFRELFENANDIIYTLDAEANLTSINKAGERILGYTREELLARPAPNLFTPEDTEKVRNIQLSRERGAPVTAYEIEVVTRDGHRLTLEVSSRFIQEGNPLAGVQGIARDVTERRLAENRIREQAALLDSAQDAIFVHGIDQRIRFWNKGAERLYGWTHAEALGRSVEELLYDDPFAFRKVVDGLRESGEWSGEIAQRCKDGRIVTVEGHWTLVPGESGQGQSVLSINTDITARIAMEEMLQQSQRLEAVGHLTGGVAHDFNNLLTVILGNSELLVERLSEEPRLRTLAEMIQTAAARGADLTHRLLAFARRQALEPSAVAIDGLLEGIEGLLGRTLGENIEIGRVAAPDLWAALVDPSQLEGAILNLCINARDAMPGGGKLLLETANVRIDAAYSEQHPDVQPGEYVLAVVSDTGAGIAPENLGRVFDPFFTTKPFGKGTGLGLSMVYGFVKQSRGHISIYSEVGQGTTVKMYLPRAEIEAGAAGAPEPEADSADELRGTEAVLLVEDDDLVRRYAEDQIAGLGYRVLSAANAREALEILEGPQEVDLLFTDVMMPGGMNGRELVDAARRRRPHLRVLYTSGYTENVILHHGRLDPGIQLLDKPYSRLDLARKIRAALAGLSPTP